MNTSSNNQQTNNTLDEQALIDRLFLDDSQDANGEGFPLVEPPAHLKNALYDIPSTRTRKVHTGRWLGAAALAASVVIAILLIPQPAPINQDALQAQKDFELALHYLNKANKKAASSVTSTLNTELERSTVNPIVKTLTNLSSS